MHNRLHYLRNSCFNKRREAAARPEPQCTAATFLFNTADGAQASYPSTTHTSTTASIPISCKAPPPCDCLCSPGPGSARVRVSGRTSISQFKTAHAGAPHPAGPHHSTHRTRSPTPHGTTAAGHGSKHQGATPLLCPLAGSGPSARRAAAAAATCRHSSEQVFLPEELRAREVGRVGKHVAHLGGGYVEPLRNAMPDSFP